MAPISPALINNYINPGKLCNQFREMAVTLWIKRSFFPCIRSLAGSQ